MVSGYCTSDYDKAEMTQGMTLPSGLLLWTLLEVTEEFLLKLWWIGSGLRTVLHQEWQLLPGLLLTLIPLIFIVHASVVYVIADWLKVWVTFFNSMHSLMNPWITFLKWLTHGNSMKNFFVWPVVDCGAGCMDWERQVWPRMNRRHFHLLELRIPLLEL